MFCILASAGAMILLLVRFGIPCLIMRMLDSFGLAMPDRRQDALSSRIRLPLFGMGSGPSALRCSAIRCALSSTAHNYVFSFWSDPGKGPDRSVTGAICTTSPFSFSYRASGGIHVPRRHRQELKEKVENDGNSGLKHVTFCV